MASTVIKNNDFMRFAQKSESYADSLSDFMSWFKARAEAAQFDVEEIPLDEVNGWKIDLGYRGLHHQSGKFFSVQGLQVEINEPYSQKWQQPIINQPEIGILGILSKKFKGVPHFLMQMKMEPGNINKAQLSPTVQATKSNYTQVHKGKLPAYLAYFLERKGTVIADQLQSEQGARFLRKRNRNMIIAIDEDIEIDENFYWLSLGQLKQLYCYDNLVNMDARSVLSMIQLSDLNDINNLGAVDASHDFYRDLQQSIVTREEGAHRFDDLISWFTYLKSNYAIATEIMPLSDLQDWTVSPQSISHKEGDYFSVIGVRSKLSGREVSEWCQPLLKHDAVGLVGLLCQKINGVLHFLINARMEPGYIDVIEMGATVSTSDPNRYQFLQQKPHFLDQFLDADKESIRCDFELSEEGGRFYHFRNRYSIVELDEAEKLPIPEGYTWLTYGQLLRFIRHSLYVNIELRSLMSALPLSKSQSEPLPKLV
ncbi:MAG: NDP-hexose 2,3-dehydratase family protein [Thiotrichales bacterium]|nr:NDP-hexose 2,3-dehydratase family protein [Thiotrichales bacterium]